MRARLWTVLALLAVLAVAGPAVGATGGKAKPPPRTWHVSLRAPAQFNLTFAELRFASRGASPLALSLTKAPGLYFAAAALVRKPISGGPRALVVVVNERPRGSLAPDRATIGLHVTGATSLGALSIRTVVNPFRGTVGPRATARLCGLGRDHGAASLSKLLSAGRPLAGFSTAAAVAEAYDVACGLPYETAFERAVTGCATTLVAGCCPANAMCVAPPPAPTPTPAPTPSPTPTPVPTPVCPCRFPPTNCAPGYACPLAAAADVRAIACPLGASPSIAC
jgi:hypothetical protein